MMRGRVGEHLEVVGRVAVMSRDVDRHQALEECFRGAVVAGIVIERDDHLQILSNW